MKFDENLAAVHAYLCGDGYVVKNLPTQKLKYYRIGFRNTNYVLLKDFQNRFNQYFGIKPSLRKGERCEKGSREIYETLTKSFGSFYSREWSAPRLNKRLMGIWLRAFFDCEGWVFCKSHQNRHIGLDSVNEEGLDQIRKNLDTFNIGSIKKVNKKRRMFRIFIYGKENLEKFRSKIGFLHPGKKEALDKAILDYVDYNWDISKDSKLIRELMWEKAKIRKPYFIRVISREEDNLKKLRGLLSELFSIDQDAIKINKSVNGIGTVYFELCINRRLEVGKLLKQNLINGDQLKKIKGIDTR